jgi:hypothetical protein
MTEETIGSLIIDMEVTTEERRHAKEEERRYASDKQYRAELRAELQRHSAPGQNSSLPWMLGIGLVLAGAVIWFVEHLRP